MWSVPEIQGVHRGDMIDLSQDGLLRNRLAKLSARMLSSSLEQALKPARLLTRSDHGVRVSVRGALALSHCVLEGAGDLC